MEELIRAKIRDIIIEYLAEGVKTKEEIFEQIEKLLSKDEISYTVNQNGRCVTFWICQVGVILNELNRNGKIGYTLKSNEESKTAACRSGLNSKKKTLLNFVDVDQYFSTFINEDNYRAEYILLQYLSLRGYTVEINHENKLVCKMLKEIDRQFLIKFIRDNKVGSTMINKIDGSLEIKVKHDVDVIQAARKLFLKSTKLSHECITTYSTRFCNDIKNTRDSEANVSWLEPFISKYIIAINSCGIETEMSCDGNHKTGDSEMYITFKEESFAFWHKVIVSTLFSKGDNIWNYNDWNVNVKLTPENVTRIYILVSTIADKIMYYSDDIYRIGVDIKRDLFTVKDTDEYWEKFEELARMKLLAMCEEK